LYAWRNVRDEEVGRKGGERDERYMKEERKEERSEASKEGRKEGWKKGRNLHVPPSLSPGPAWRPSCLLACRPAFLHAPPISLSPPLLHSFCP
jgi:hypothetical protein